MKKFGMVLLMCLLSINIEKDVQATQQQVVVEETTQTELSLEEYIVGKLKNKEQTINISEYGITTDEIIDVYCEILDQHPELFYVKGELSCSYSSDNIVKTLTITYTDCSQEEIDNVYKEMQKPLKMLSEEMTEVEKILFLHDYLCVHVEYSEADLKSEQYHNIKGVALEGKAVCEGYTRAFLYFMNELGIPCKIVKSSGHVWNQIQLDGKWYMVDVTYDDPVFADYGYVRHTYFLKSSSKMTEHTWEEEKYEICDSTLYDDAFWNHTQTQIIYYNGDWYYVNDEDMRLYCCHYTNGEWKVKDSQIMNFTEYWKVFGGEQYYTKSYIKLAKVSDKLIYSTPSKIYRCDFDAGNPECLISADTTNGYIYGMKVKDGQIIYQLAKEPYSEEKKNETYDLNAIEDIADAKIQLSQESFDYNGEQQYPQITVTFGVEELELNKHYTVEYVYPESGIGQVLVTLTGKGYYTGTKTVSYEIVVKPAENADSVTVKNEIIISDEKELVQAIRNAQPGDEIVVMPGIYQGKLGTGSTGSGFGSAWFNSDQDGTKENPIILRSYDMQDKAVLTGTEQKVTGLRITGDYWIIEGIEVANTQKGIILDNSNHSIIRNCVIHDTLQEGLHLRDGSSYNYVTQTAIYKTGTGDPGYGEGIYIGSDKNKWSSLAKECDYNVISGCTLGPDIAAEHFDIKEGTTGTIIEKNVMHGAGITGENYADSFIDAKGNYAIVRENICYRENNEKIVAAFQTHQQVEGWGLKNSFIYNSVELDEETIQITQAAQKAPAYCFGNQSVPENCEENTYTTILEEAKAVELKNLQVEEIEQEIPDTTEEQITTENEVTEQETTKELTTEQETSEKQTTEKLTTEQETSGEVRTEELTSEQEVTPEISTEELTSEQRTTEKLTIEQTPTKEPSTEKLTSEQEATEKQTSEQQGTTKISTEQLTSEQRTTEKQTSEQKGTTEISTEELTSEQRTTEKLTTEQEGTTEISTEQLTSEERTTEKLTTEQEATPEISTEQLTSEQEATEKLTTEQEGTTEISTEQLTSEERTTEKQTSEQKGTTEISTEQLTSEERTTEKQTSEQKGTTEISTEELTSEQRTTEKLTTEQERTTEISTEQLTSEERTTEKLTTEQERTTEISTEQLTSEQRTTEKLTTEQKGTTEISTEELTSEQRTTEKTTELEKTTEKVTEVGTTTEIGITTEKTTEVGSTTEITIEKLTSEQISTEKQTSEQVTSEQQSTEKQTTELKVEKINVKEKSFTINLKKTKMIKATVSPSNATNKKLIYTSSNKAVATVDANGKVKAVAPGVAKITIKSVNGILENVTVKVKPAKVTALKKTRLSKTKVKISWKKQSNVTGYKVYRLNAKTKKYVLYKITKYNYVSVANLKKNTTYTFKIKAYKRSGSIVVNGDNSKGFKVKIK